MTKEEIKAAAKEYMIKVKADDINEGYDVHDLRYSDLKYAFEEGAEWAQSQLVHRPDNEDGITSDELNHQIYAYRYAIDKAAEWLYANDFGIGMSKRELIDKFKEAMEKPKRVN